MPRKVVLERAVKELRRANAILRSASASFCGGARPPTAVSVEDVDAHRDQLGVEPICTVLLLAPSTYYAAKARPPSARSVTDTVTTTVIRVVHEQNCGVYGARKVHAALRRRGHRVHGRPVARCTGQRLMGGAGLRGITRAKGPRTTITRSGADTRPDLVDREVTATAPGQLWVADIT